jgi:hypothetical protein
MDRIQKKGHRGKETKADQLRKQVKADSSNKNQSVSSSKKPTDSRFIQREPGSGGQQQHN